MVTEGYVSDVKAALITHISQADSELQPEASHVYPKWNLDVWQLNTSDMPVATVRVGPATVTEVAYGRKITHDTDGVYVSLYFTIHLHHTADATGDPSKSTMDLAEKVVTKLLKSDNAASGIVYYERVTHREASGAHNALARAIIEGYVVVKRPI